MSIRRIVLAVLLIALTAGACAPKTVAPPTPGAPKYSEFVFPVPATTFPADVVQQHQAAWDTLQTGDGRGAERRFTALLKRAPDFYPAHAGLGYVAMARDNMKMAIGHFDRALAGNGNYAPALAGKGQAHLALNERGPALASFDAALVADPSLSSIRSAADVLRFQVIQGGVAEARKAADAGRFPEARAGYEAAIQASPESPFLYRELAMVEFRAGVLEAAAKRIEKALALEPNDPRNHVVLADIMEATGNTAGALQSLQKAVAIEPSEALDRRIESLREKAALAAMPEEYRAIESAETITRGQLAALIGVRFDALVKRASERRPPAVITDVRGHWAFQWILRVTQAGFMQIYPNNTFQPNATATRLELVTAASGILNVIAAQNPSVASAWTNARPRFSDLPLGNANYGAAARAVSAGVVQTIDKDSIQLSKSLTGPEAMSAVDRLLALAEGRR